MNTALQIDILEFVFKGRNKEYGAYLLRSTYHKTLTRAMIFSISFFILSISSPLLSNYFFPVKRATYSTTSSALDLKSTLVEKSSIPKQNIQVPVERPKESLTKTIAFTVPVIAIDDQVSDKELLPSIIELQKVDPGRRTQDGIFAPIEIGIKDLSNNIIEEPVVNGVSKNNEPEVFRWVEQMPTFPGGEESLLNFLSSNINYPDMAKRVQIEGRVTIHFVVNAQGKIRDISVVKGIGAGCDEEAVRVIALMPDWTPGLQNGKPVSVHISIPILFNLK